MRLSQAIKLGGYGILAMPLAMVALPIYVYVPKFYSEMPGVSLATIGFTLFLVRVIDAFQDPFIGYLSDRYQPIGIGRTAYIICGIPLMILGVVAVFNPQIAEVSNHVGWLIFSMIVLYFGLSLVYINFLAIGAEVGESYNEHTRISGVRSVFGIVGITIALVLPELLRDKYGGLSESLSVFSLIMIPIFLFCLLFFYSFYSRASRSKTVVTINNSSNIFGSLKYKSFRKLLIVFLFSGVSTAIPGLLILFFVTDIIEAESYASAFIIVYFLCAAIAVPFWVKLAHRFGKKKAWLMGMIMAVGSFSAASMIGSGDILPFFVICVLSGFANGSDLTLPLAMVADQIRSNQETTNPQVNGEYFGIWQFLEKANLGLAAGVSLPLLSFFNYEPNALSGNHTALQIMYAIVPCTFKIIAALLLFYSPIDEEYEKTQFPQY